MEHSKTLFLCSTDLTQFCFGCLVESIVYRERPGWPRQSHNLHRSDDHFCFVRSAEYKVKDVDLAYLYQILITQYLQPD